MSSQKNKKRIHKKSSKKVDFNAKIYRKKQYSRYFPLMVLLITTIFVFLLTLFLCEGTVAFGIIFSCSVGLLFGSAFLTSEAVENFHIKNNYIYIVMSSVLSFLGLLSIFAFIGVYPFGQNSVLTVDMTQQYIPFYASVRSILFGDHSLVYSQALGMGGNYWSLAGYYLCSPFVLLSLFLPKEALPDFMAVLELIKIALAGGFFAYFYRCKFNRDDITVPIASLCYTMTSFMLLHMCTVIWTDCLVLLPLLVLGVENIVRGGKPWLYILCLTISLISNYYISYIICIYLLLYYIAEIFVESKKFNLKSVAANFLKFIVSSLLSIGMASFVLMPSAFALRESASAGDEAAEELLVLNPLKILSQFMYNSEFDILSDDSMPLVYCSIFVLILVPLFFACKTISSRIKISFGCLTGLLLLSLAVNKLNFIWHGMHIPNKLPYRFSFLLCFTLLIIAGYVTENLKTVSSNAFTFGLIGMIAVVLGIYFIDGADNTIMLVGTLGFAVVYTVILVMRSEKKITSAAAMAITLAVVFAEVTTNGVSAWKNLSEESPYSVRDDYISSCIDREEIVNQIKVSDSDVYRIESLGQGTINDGAMLGYGSISYFSSTNNGALMNLLKNVGYNCDERVAYYYKSFTPLMDSVFNLKYIIYDENVGNPPYLELQAIDSERFAYRNTLTLPRAFAVSNSLINWNTEQKNPFDVQNDFVKNALGTEDDVYLPENFTVDEALTDGVQFDSGSTIFSEMGGILTLNYTADSRRHIYAYVNCPGASGININVGENEYHIDDTDVYVMDLGYCNESESVNVCVTAAQSLDGYISLASLNEAVLEDSIARLGAVPAEFTEYGDTHIVCVVNAESNCLLFTSIPYEQGWSVYVNGKKTDAEAIGGGLIGVPLSAGENTVELKYFPRGLSAGIVISLLSFALTAVLLFRRKIIDLFTIL